MSCRLLAHSLIGMGLAASLGACSAPDLSQPCPIPPDVVDTLNNSDPSSQAYQMAEAQYQAALLKCFPAMGEQYVDTALKKDVDILFLIDNSTSMSPKQAQLAAVIPKFIQEIDATGANYHVGVATSDVGTLPAGLSSFPGVQDPRCGTQNGDDGLLQNIPCTSRTNGSANGVTPSPEAIAACNMLCPDPTQVPKDRWIAKENGVNNIGTGNDPNAPINAFKCIGLVSDTGCGVEQQLEGAKRALDGHLMENSGFLRDNSVLAVIWITDEDDCSVQPAQRVNLNPTAMNCSMSADPPDNCYNLDYRCMAKDITCAQPLDTIGPKTGCTERTDTWLNPLDLYSRFFSGLRDSQHLVLAGIWSPSLEDFANGKTTPFGNGQLYVDTETTGSNQTSLLNRGPLAEAACYNSDKTLTSDPKGYIGQAEWRLEGFKLKFDQSIWSEQSICDPTNYTHVLDLIAQKITKALGADCVQVNPNLDSAGNPECLVGYVDANQPDALPDVYMPTCSATCCNAWAASPQPIGQYNGMVGKDPNIISACTAESQDCYCAVPSTQGLCTGTVVAGVWQKGNATPPAGKVVNFRCAGTRPAAAM